MTDAPSPQRAASAEELRPDCESEVEAPAMIRVLHMIDALPDGFKPSDDVPLREALPGGWPTIGELREFVAFSSAAPPIADEAMRVVAFSLAIDDDHEARSFLSGWAQGDTSEWPEFAAFGIAPAVERREL